MVRKAAVLGLAIAALLPVPSAAEASAAPDRYSFEASFSFTHPYLSQQCGTPGDLKQDRNRRPHDLVQRRRPHRREVDYSPASKITITAPSLGTSFTTVRSSLLTWDYGAGAQLRSTVTITAHGSFGDISGPHDRRSGHDDDCDDPHRLHLRGRSDGRPPGRPPGAPNRPTDRPRHEAAAVCEALTGA
jgi:hypothetical protein